ncbi:MAG: hypothetical protein IJO73_00790 [Clostridia bacterium]|nr:hypothetical protein [Clostridia bacterium]
MAHNIIGAVICALAGLLIAYINYLLSRKILKAAPEKFALATVARQIIQVGYLAAVYFIGDGLTVSLVWLLVGAAVGMTVPMAFFTKKLVAFNEAAAAETKNGEEDENG